MRPQAQKEKRSMAFEGGVPMHSFWKLAGQRAWKETCESLKISVGKIISSLIVYGVAFYFIWTYQGELELLKVTTARVLITIGIISAFPVFFLYHFLSAASKIYNEATDKIRELQGRIDKEPRLKLSYAANKTIRRGNGLDQTFLYAENVGGGGDIVGVQVKIDEAMFKSEGSDVWEGTSIVARPNMSWGSLPDGNKEKYFDLTKTPPKSWMLSSYRHPIPMRNGPR
jgi:hypothetical protein